jgi:hypothetical protein
VKGKPQGYVWIGGDVEQAGWQTIVLRHGSPEFVVQERGIDGW